MLESRVEPGRRAARSLAGPVPQGEAAAARLRVLIVDDHAVLRAGLRVLLELQDDIEVVGEAADGEDAVAAAARTHPDVVLMDLAMPGQGGVAAIRALQDLAAEIKVLALTMHADAAYLRRALAAGACGYVVKSAADTELVAAIRRAARGETYLDPAVAHLLVAQAVDPPDADDPGADEETLSCREEQVLRLIAAGYTSRQAADRLQISPKTVDTHKTRGMEKLGLGNRVELVRYAMDQHWLDDPMPDERPLPG